MEIQRYGKKKAMKKIIVAITGASGAIYGIRMVQALKDAGAKVHLVISNAAHETIKAETDWQIDDIKKLADVCYPPEAIGASIASGSFDADGMVVVPCSIKTLSAAANCYADDLVARACDVTLKERRRLILMVRESPFHLGHIQLMEKVTLMGGMIVPLVTTMYTKPKSVADIVDHTVGKTLNLLGIDSPLFKRWE